MGKGGGARRSSLCTWKQNGLVFLEAAEMGELASPGQQGHSPQVLEQGAELGLKQSRDRSFGFFFPGFCSSCPLCLEQVCLCPYD